MTLLYMCGKTVRLENIADRQRLVGQNIESLNILTDGFQMSHVLTFVV